MSLSSQSSEVFVVLATYNGARYVNDQIESIRRQSYPEWTLLIRDDQSTDATGRILHELAAADKRIQVLDDGGARLGAAQNFGRLLQEAYDRGARYVFTPIRTTSGDRTNCTSNWRGCGKSSRPASRRRNWSTQTSRWSTSLQVVDPSFALFPAPLETAEPWKTLIEAEFRARMRLPGQPAVAEFALPAAGG